MVVGMQRWPLYRRKPGARGTDPYVVPDLDFDSVRESGLDLHFGADRTLVLLFEAVQ
jgi:hypothetical protein